MQNLKRFFRYHLPPFIWAFLIMIASSIPADKLPNVQIFGWDKIAHVCVFFIFGILILRSLYHRNKTINSKKQIAMLTVVFVVSFGIFDELFQSIIPGRTSDIYDLVADAVGGILAVSFFNFINRYARNKNGRTVSNL
ncbi:MAG: VanZ family protein [Bacteroidota bacterium]|nr:VanZ family protein [Bacteroidota bacterium]